MPKELFLLPEKIKLLREKCGLTQAALAKKLGLTRASINAWEMGLSTPSTPYLVELAQLFHVSVDYLLGLSRNQALDLAGLTPREVACWPSWPPVSARIVRQIPDWPLCCLPFAMPHQKKQGACARSCFFHAPLYSSGINSG